MRTTRYSTSRQKACQQCSNAKAKCDRKPGECSRCALRGLSCTYPQAQLPRGSSIRGEDDDGQAESNHSHFVSDISLMSPELDLSHGTVSSQSPIVESVHYIDGNSSAKTFPKTITRNIIAKDTSFESLSSHKNFDLELFCPINVDDIKNRWLNSYVPIPGQKVKEYAATTSAFIYRILNSYVSIAVRGRGVPPFVHLSQVMASTIKPPIATCLSLVRICEKPLPGSENVAADVLQREMEKIYEQHGSYEDDLSLLAAFQAYLIYSMVFFFRLSQGADPFLRQAMINLQHLACSNSRGGLMCIAEQQIARPSWDAWVIAEAKRRTLFSMYLFDSILSAQDGLPTFLGTELQGLLAPSSRSLWTMQARSEWEMAYNSHLTDWPEGGLRIDELWPVPADMDEARLLERRSRVDQWLEGIDEFGTMLYAVTSSTHGG